MDGATRSAGAIRPEVAVCGRGPEGRCAGLETGVPSRRAIKSRGVPVPAPAGIFHARRGAPEDAPRREFLERLWSDELV